MNNPPLLPLNHPDAPKYWMHETTGDLAQAVQRYLNEQKLDAAQIRLMRLYLWQWVRSPVWGASGLLEVLRVRVAAIGNEKDVEACIAAAVALGMDPL